MPRAESDITETDILFYALESKQARSPEALAEPPEDRSPMLLLIVVSRIVAEATLNAPLP